MMCETLLKRIDQLIIERDDYIARCSNLSSYIATVEKQNLRLMNENQKLRNAKCIKSK